MKINTQKEALDYLAELHEKATEKQVEANIVNDLGENYYRRSKFYQYMWKYELI